MKIKGLLLCCLLPPSLMAGTITGTVKAEGPALPGQASGDGAYSSMRYKFAEKVDYDHLEDFVIYIDQAVAEPPGSPPPMGAVTQHDVGFEPHVLPIVVGTTVRWPNKDDIFHNVFSTSDVKAFDLGLYTSEKVPEILFDKAGRVDVFCSIHSKMHCIILVLPNRHFAKVNSNQRYQLRDVPAGTYKVKAWQERMPAQALEVTVPAQGEVTVNFKLGFAELPRN